MNKFTATIPGPALIRALRWLGWVVEKRTTMPILTHVHIAAHDGGVVLTGGDLDSWLSITLPCRGGSGEICLHREQLQNCANGYKDNVSLDLVADGKNAGKVSISVGGVARLYIPCLPAAGFPAAPEGKATAGARLNLDVFGWAIENCEPVVSTEETRYYLNGVLLDYGTVGTEKCLHAVATDGHQMRYALLQEAASLSKQKPVSAIKGIIPRKVCKALRNVLLGSDPSSEIVITQHGQSMRFAAESWTLTSRLIDGEFPDWQRVIPKRSEYKVSATFGAAELYGAIDLVCAIGKPDTMELDVRQDHAIVTVTGEGADASDRVPADVAAKLSALPMRIGVNPTYLMKAMAAVEQRATVMIADHQSPLLITDPDEPNLVQIMMPKRIAAQPAVKPVKALPPPAPEAPAAEPVKAGSKAKAGKTKAKAPAKPTKKAA